MLGFLRHKRTKTIWWVLIFVTVITFLGGFVFLLGSGLDSSNRARASGAVGTVNGSQISKTDWQNALADQREGYKRRYGTDPVDQDLKMVEVQTWRSLVIQRLLGQEAKSLGLEAHDREVVLNLQTSPPAALTSAPAFQTNGKFDPAKYQAAMRDPGNNWAPFEDLARSQIPMRKLQERLITSIKLTEPELSQAFRDRYEKVSATVVHVPPTPDSKAPAPSEADLDRAFEKYKSRLTTGPRTQLEVMQVPIQHGPEETRTARELAQSLANRARKGEDFAALARDYSEGPAADKGGVIDRAFQLSDFGADLRPKIAALAIGGVTDPVQSGARFIVFTRVQPGPADSTGPGIHLAQIVVKVRTNENQLRDQYAEMVKLRNRAAKIGLGKAAAEKGLSTSRVGPYTYTNTPQELEGVPQASDWGLTSRAGAVSPVFEGMDVFAVAQVTTQSPGGTAAREEVREPLSRLALLDAALDRARPTSDSLARLLASGRSLEQAAQAVGLSPIKIDGTTRLQPDPRIGGAPELMGALFASPPGKVVGPIRTLSGWFFARVEHVTPPDLAMFDQIKNQISNDLLQRRQQTFLNEYLSALRVKADVRDLRDEPAY